MKADYNRNEGTHGSSNYDYQYIIMIAISVCPFVSDSVTVFYILIF